jgi:hypothetical protein
MSELYSHQAAKIAYLWTAGKGHHNSLIPTFTKQDILVDMREGGTTGIDQAVRSLLGWSYGNIFHYGALKLDGHTCITPEQVEQLHEVECVVRCHVGYDTGSENYTIFANVFLTTYPTVSGASPPPSVLLGVQALFNAVGVAYPTEKLISAVELKCSDDNMRVTQYFTYPSCYNSAGLTKRSTTTLPKHLGTCYQR